MSPEGQPGIPADTVRDALNREIAAIRERRSRDPKVLDVGGGSGVWAVPLAQQGCSVTVIDPSPDALATLQRRATEVGVAEQVRPLQGDLDVLEALCAADPPDLVLAHGLLEYVEDAHGAAEKLVATTAPGGALSLLVANRHAAVLTRLLAGKVGEARELLSGAGASGSAGVEAQRRFSTDELVALCSAVGLEVESVAGHEVFSEWLPQRLEGDAHELAQLEVAAARHAPWRDIASKIHAIGRVPDQPA